MGKLGGLLIIVAICLMSCGKYRGNYKVVRKEEIKAAFILNSSPTFKGYFYKGSDFSFHYFVSRWYLQKDKYFKIDSKWLKINYNFKFKKDDKEIRIDVIESENGEFGEFAENEFCKLYIQKYDCIIVERMHWSQQKPQGW